MSTSLIYFALVSIWIAGLSAPVCASAHLADSKDVVISVKDARLTGDLVQRVADPDASTGVALYFGGTAGHASDADPDSDATGSYATVHFEAAAGTYFVWLRGRGEGTLADAAWIRFDPKLGTPVATDAPYGFGNWSDDATADKYRWSSQAPGLPPIQITFREQGEHDLSIFARQPGFHLDQIWLSRTQSTRPSDDAPGVQDPGAAGFVPLFNGEDLTGWVTRGGQATYSVDDGCIVGAVGPGPNSFLCTEREFADFELRIELILEEPGNSGIQIRSHVNEAGRVYGYQCEVDPSERAWSGGIFEEGARGWLFPLKDKVAQAAFKLDDWNQYVIRAEGRRIRTWVNGVPCADFMDEADEAAASGFIGLQVHGGKTGRIRWKNPLIRSL